MRHFVAAALVVGSLAAPALRTWCEISCAAEDKRPTATSHCHEPSDEPAPVSVQAPGDCGDHATLPAVVADVKSPRDSVAPLLLQSAAVVSLVDPLVAGARFTKAHARGSTSPPIPPGTRILRV